MILEAYLQQFARACSKAGGWYGLDLFAGSGGNWSQLRQVERPSSPLIALRAEAPRATKVIAAESSEGLFAALRARTLAFDQRVSLYNADANLAIESVLREVPVKAPAFAFLDPEGSELDWRTVQAIADHKRGHSNKVEQLILFGERIMDHCFNQVRVRVREELGQTQLFTLPEAERRKRLGER